MLVVPSLALVAACLARDHREHLAGGFERRLRMRDEVVVPRRVLLGAALRGRDDELVAVAVVGHDRGSILAGLRTPGGHDRERTADQRPGRRRPTVGAKVL